MANTNLKAPSLDSPRRVTVRESVRYRPNSSLNTSKPVFYPWIKLAGRWIENAGFLPGQHVTIEVQHQRLIITPASE